MPLWKKRLIIAAIIAAFVLMPATMFGLLSHSLHSLGTWWDSLKAQEGWH